MAEPQTLSTRGIEPYSGKKPESVAELDSPALLVDLDVMEDNIRKMAKFAKQCGVKLRPHVKTHKVPAIAKMQLEAGSTGVCVQKVSEAEVFANAGFVDIFITNEIVGSQKLERLARLAEKRKISLAVDNPDNILEISEKMKEAGVELTLFVDVDVGMHRCGVRPERAPALAKLVSGGEGVRFGGIMAYEGNVGGAKSDEERAQLCQTAADLATQAKSEVARAGITVEELSMGSSVSVWTNAKNPEVTEVQPGMYIFNDGFLMSNKVATKQNCALTVLATVMSAPENGRAVVDAGSKAFNFDMRQFPIPFDREGIEMVGFSEEHGWLRVADGATGPTIGDRIRFVPYHCCTCVNQHDWMWSHRSGRVENLWRIEARGMMN